MMLKRLKVIVINPVPEELGSRVFQMLNAGGDSTQFEDITPVSLQLTYNDKKRRNKSSSKPRVAPNQNPRSGAYTVELRECLLDAENIMPNRTFGQLAVFDRTGDKRLALLNLSLSRYLTIFALVDKKLNSSDENKDSAVCRAEDFERVFFEFAKEFGHEKTGERVAAEIVRFLDLMKPDLAKKGISLIQGRLSRGYSLAASRAQIKFVSSPDNWSSRLNSQNIFQ